MRELALHILDCTENSVQAGADMIHIALDSPGNGKHLGITITDNGKGIPETMIPWAADPFFTTRDTRRVGLGLSLFKACAERCNGSFEITSRPGCGTRISVLMETDHIDRPPLGDIQGTLACILAGYPHVGLAVTQNISRESIFFDTRRKGSIAGSTNGHDVI